MNKHILVVILLISLIIIFFQFFGRFKIVVDKYDLINQDGIKIEASFMECGDRFMFNVKGKEPIITVIDTTYIAVNEGLPIKISDKLYYFKNENFTVNIDTIIRYSNDTFYIDHFQFYNVMLSENPNDSFRIIRKN